MTVRLPACTVGAAALLLACASQQSAQDTTDSASAAAAAPAPPVEPGATAAAEPAGQRRTASPRDSAVASLGSARVAVDYGRPYKRGRQIFGGLVPYGAVWRTGANQATSLVTNQPLRIGGTNVPAGSYTLYTIPAESGWTLIVNRQTGQWGTEYSEAQDLARIPMQVKQAAAPAEQFTIAIEPSGQSGGVIAMTWDTTRAEVPFTVVR